MSLCKTNKIEKDDDNDIRTVTNTNVQLPINDLLKPSNLKENSTGKPKKRKSDIPKVVKFKLDQDKDENQNHKKKSISIFHFEDPNINKIVKYEEDTINENKRLPPILKYENKKEKTKEENNDIKDINEKKETNINKKDEENEIPDNNNLEKIN